jgi:hypothetical protein
MTIMIRTTLTKAVLMPIVMLPKTAKVIIINDDHDNDVDDDGYDDL